MTLIQHGSVWNSSGNILIFVIRASSKQSWKYSSLNRSQMYIPNTINVQRLCISHLALLWPTMVIGRVKYGFIHADYFQWHLLHSSYMIYMFNSLNIYIYIFSPSSRYILPNQSITPVLPGANETSSSSPRLTHMRSKKGTAFPLSFHWAFYTIMCHWLRHHDKGA